MALQTQLVRTGKPQQVGVVSAVRLMASGAALLKCRLVQVLFLVLFGLLGVAAQADIHRIGLRESGRTASMGIVAIGAFTHRTRVLNLGLLDLLGLLGVTGNAKRLGIGLRQHNLAVLRRGMAGVTLSAGKGRVRELRHQLWLSGLVRIVAGEAVGLVDRLVLMRFANGCVLRIVAVDAQRRGVFGQMEVELALAGLAGLMRDVAGVAAHIERRVPAAALGHIHALRCGRKGRDSRPWYRR